jgi:hypothetical protein
LHNDHNVPFQELTELHHDNVVALLDCKVIIIIIIVVVVVVVVVVIEIVVVL